MTSIHLDYILTTLNLNFCLRCKSKKQKPKYYGNPQFNCGLKFLLNVKGHLIKKVSLISIKILKIEL